MNTEIHLLAAKACQAVYGENTKIGSTNYAYTLVMVGGATHLMLAIAGTNDGLDRFWNLCPVTKDGVKYGSYLSAKRIYENHPKHLAHYQMIVTGHSKAGPTAAHYKEKYCRETDQCVMFDPARGFLKSKPLKNTVMYIDLDDLVPKLGALRFKHRDCPVVFMPRDVPWWNLRQRVRNHSMEHTLKFLEIKAAVARRLVDVC